MNPDAAMTYLDFVAARHQVWVRRQRGLFQPWTNDLVVASRKFTNVFRVLDHGSQFLVKELIGPDVDPVTTLLRCVLYRYTNRPDVWLATRDSWGHYPTVEKLGRLADFWVAWRDLLGGQVFSGAYVIIPRPGVAGADKVRDAVALATRVVADAGQEFCEATTVEERYHALRRQPNIGDFMAMQITTDYGYSPHGAGTSEDEFVVAGPGACKGAAAIGMKPAEAIRWAHGVLRSPPVDVVLPLPGGSVRAPSLMDVQNTFCEFSKYVRYAERPTTKPYQPAHPGPQPTPVLPTHW